MPSGFNEDTPNDVIYDVGVLTFGGDLDTGTRLGVTRGGVSFNPNKTYRQVQGDGLKNNIGGLDRVTEWDAEFTGTLIQYGSDLIPYFDPGATGTGTITPGPASVPIAVADLIPLPTLTFTRASGGTFAIQFEYGLVVDWSISGEDNNEAEVEFTIKARLDPEAVDFDTDKCPYVYIITEAA